MTLDQLAHNTAEDLEAIAARPDLRDRDRRLGIYKQRIRHALGVAWKLGKRSVEDD